MLIVRSAGRLGNQLFMFSACSKMLKRGERLVLFGFDELVDSFPKSTHAAWHIPLPRQNWWIWTALRAVIVLLVKFGLARRMTLAEDGSHLRTKRGIGPLTIFDAGFCQDERLLDGSKDEEMWNEARNKHSDFLHSYGLGRSDENSSTYFVHVRRGDYLTHPSREFPAVLPSRWFTQQIETIRDTDPEARFLMFSDDADYCRQKFGSEKNLTLVQGDATESLIAMSLCAGGILSASSFAWWAAYLSSARNAGPFIAPKYWINWRTENWGTETLQTSAFIDWVEVTPSEY